MFSIPLLTPYKALRLCASSSFLFCGKYTAVDFIFRNTVLCCTYIFDTHLITFSNDFHVACHRVSLDDCKKNLPTSPPPRLRCPPQVRKYCPLVPEEFHYCSTTPPGGKIYFKKKLHLVDVILVITVMTTPGGCTLGGDSFGK